MSDAYLYRLPQYLSVARRKKSISQAELGRAVGVGASRISAIETGQSVGIGEDIVSRISASLHLSQAEHRAMALAAAHDRVMKEVVRNHPFVESQEFLAHCLDAAPTISSDLRSCWGRITRQLAAATDHAAKEPAMP